MEVDGQVAGSRARVDVYEHAPRPSLRGHDGRGLHRPHLVVRELHRYERGVVAHRGYRGRGGIAPEVVDRDRRHLGARSRQRVTYARMLDRGGDDVRRMLARPPKRAPHRGVDRLGARRREHDFPRPGAETRRNRSARFFERDARHAPFRMQPAGIGMVLAQERQHRVERDGTER